MQIQKVLFITTPKYKPIFIIITTYLKPQKSVPFILFELLFTFFKITLLFFCQNTLTFVLGLVHVEAIIVHEVK